LICSQIRRAFPDDPIVAEENPKELLKPERSESLKQVVDYVKEDNKDADAKKIIEWIGYGTGRVGPRFWTLDPIGENFIEKCRFN
jgi:3'(2'), 5'-bisphosphate nucleotidase